MSWSRPFDDPVPFPRGRYLVTLQVVDRRLGFALVLQPDQRNVVIL
jgi:hypothetical protein